MIEPAAHAQAAPALAASATCAGRISFLSDGAGERAYVAYYLASLHGINAMARREKLVGVLCATVPSICVGGTIAGFIWIAGHEFRWLAPIVAPWFAVPFFLFGLKGGFWTKLRRDLKGYGNDRTPRESESVSVLVSPDGFTTEFADTSRTIRWSGIGEILRLDRWIVFCHADGRDVDVVPLSAFPSETDAEAWCAYASGLVESSGDGPDARVRAAIDQGPVRCGKCGYKLVGVRVAKCPECGISLSEPQIRLWRQLQLPLYKHVRSQLRFRR